MTLLKYQIEKKEKILLEAAQFFTNRSNFNIAKSSKECMPKKSSLKKMGIVKINQTECQRSLVGVGMVRLNKNKKSKNWMTYC
jgi:hypothetical protein